MRNTLYIVPNIPLPTTDCSKDFDMSQDNEIISLIWPTWRDLILTPEHIITPCNNIPVDRLDLIVWKSHFYDRGMKETTKKLESMQILGPDIIQLMRIDHENHS